MVDGALRVQIDAHGLAAPVHAGDGAAKLFEHAVDDLDALAHLQGLHHAHAALEPPQPVGEFAVAPDERVVAVAVGQYADDVLRAGKVHKARLFLVGIDEHIAREQCGEALFPRPFFEELLHPLGKQRPPVAAFLDGPGDELFLARGAKKAAGVGVCAHALHLQVARAGYSFALRPRARLVSLVCRACPSPLRLTQ